jgi:hypothetical protein
MANPYILIRKCDERDHLGMLGVNGRIILK